MVVLAQRHSISRGEILFSLPTSSLAVAGSFFTNCSARIKARKSLGVAWRLSGISGRVERMPRMGLSPGSA
ncbi:MAG: hypothetical protein CVU58_01450, partial [Deltaproteobacteria bacterium HGW-Deltaproteobacteria-16]